MSYQKWSKSYLTELLKAHIEIAKQFNESKTLAHIEWEQFHHTTSVNNCKSVSNLGNLTKWASTVTKLRGKLGILDNNIRSKMRKDKGYHHDHAWQSNNISVYTYIEQRGTQCKIRPKLAALTVSSQCWDIVLVCIWLFPQRSLSLYMSLLDNLIISSFILYW